MKAFAQAGLEEAKSKFAADEMSIETFDAEAEFWLSCDACDVCDARQMCSYHYERLVYG